MHNYLKDALSGAAGGVAALVAVGGKLPRDCTILASDEIGMVLRWSSLPDTYLFPWNRIEAVVLKAG